MDEALSVLMLCAPSNRRWPFLYHTKIADRVFSCFVRFLVKQIGINSQKCIEYKPQRGRLERAELPDVNINTGAQSINTESFFNMQMADMLIIRINTFFACESNDVDKLGAYA